MNLLKSVADRPNLIRNVYRFSSNKMESPKGLNTKSYFHGLKCSILIHVYILKF